MRRAQRPVCPNSPAAQRDARPVPCRRSLTDAFSDDIEVTSETINQNIAGVYDSFETGPVIQPGSGLGRVEQD